MSDENENGRPGGRPPMTLKPRQGSVSAGVVKQSFSHGRTKTVVVETKRTRPHAPAGGNLAAPSSAERRHSPDAPAPRPQSAPQGGGSTGGLSQEELRARQRVVDAAREAQARQQAEQAAAEARARAAQEA
ncbi:translation initiation factor IF-2 associated domain-containing protein, partial [uncultured Caulobacter sp.]|uniref:translation initiation factor IF-2 associated domain-containing protein n=1 Tax=uncultured Caulobacter sp. TaxID=158749 RepID=UPI002611C428